MEQVIANLIIVGGGLLGLWCFLMAFVVREPAEAKAEGTHPGAMDDYMGWSEGEWE